MQMDNTEHITDPHALPWPFEAHLPQRFSGNYARYLERGGIVERGAFARGFIGPQGENSGDLARFLAFCLAFDQIAKDGVTGDLAEIGVYRGHTAAVLATFARRIKRELWLLDTFQGFDAADLRGIDQHAGMQFEDTSLDAVRAMVGTDLTHYVAGRFPDTADRLPNGSRYALVHIDCDLYAPITAALEYFYPRMSAGGFIIIHDYSSLCWDGAERAVDDFFRDKPEFVVPMPDGCGSAAVRKCAPH